MEVGVRVPSRDEIKAKFTSIYQDNSFGSDETVSGPGSELPRTAALRAGLQGVLARHKITSILDIPCGDFHWMQHLDLTGIDYLGADIVEELIDRDRDEYEISYAVEGPRFTELDIVYDELPEVDLVLSRDVFGHFTDSMILAALENVKRSRSIYFATTTFPDLFHTWPGILGGWRPINLEDDKFELPRPVWYIVEYTSDQYGQKCLGLWELDALRGVA